MPVLSIEFDDDITIPDNILSLKQEEWVIILNSLSEILQKHEEVISKTSIEELKSSLKDKHKEKITKLQHIINNKQEEIQDLRVKISSEVDRIRRENEENIAKERAENEEKTKKHIANVLYNIEQDYKRELEYKNSNISTLQKELERCSLSIDQLKSYYDKELKNKELTIKQQLANQYNSERVILEKELEAVRISSKKNIDSMKESINELQNNYDEKLNSMKENLSIELKTQYEHENNMLQQELTRQQLAAERYKQEKLERELLLSNEIVELKDLYDKKLSSVKENITSELSAQQQSDKKLYEIQLSQLKTSLSHYEKEIESIKTSYDSQYKIEKQQLIQELADSKRHLLKTISEKQLVEQSYDEVKSYYETKLSSIKELTMKELMERFDAEKKAYDREISLHKAAIEQMRIDKMELNNLYKTSLSTANSTQIILSELKDKLISNKKTAQEKGEEGEEHVDMLLRNPRYSDALLTDTSGQGGLGDRFFKWKKIKCLIEVKNKKPLSLDDMTKFTSNIKTSLYPEKRINCALFISLKTNNFPKKTMESIQIEYESGIPVVYLYLETDIMLYSAICLLDKMLSIDINNNEQVDNLKKYYIRYHDSLAEDILLLDKQIKERTKEVAVLSRRRDKLQCEIIEVKQNLHLCIDGIINDNDNDNDNNQDCDATDPDGKAELDQSIEEKKQELNDIIINTLKPQPPKRPPTYKKTTVAISDMPKEEANKRLLDIITIDVYQKIKEFKRQHNRLPDRHEMMHKQNRILTDNELRKITNIHKTSRVVEFVMKFCKENYPDDQETPFINYDFKLLKEKKPADE